MAISSRAKLQVAKTDSRSNKSATDDGIDVKNSSKPQLFRRYIPRLVIPFAICMYLLNLHLLYGWFALLGPSSISPFIVMILLIVISIAVVFRFGCAVRKKHLPSPDFDGLVDGIAAKICEECQNNDAMLNSLLSDLTPPPSGTFHVIDKKLGIQDRINGKTVIEGLSCRSIMRLTFTESPTVMGGWTIRGSRTTSVEVGSQRSTFIIKRGLVVETSTATKKAYWEEEESSSSSGIRRVVVGQFDVNFISFSGEWLSLDGLRGSIDSIGKNDCLDLQFGGGQNDSCFSFDVGETNYTQFPMI